MIRGGEPQLATEGVDNIGNSGKIRTPESPQKAKPLLQMSDFSVSAGKTTLSTGKNFKDHFLRHKKLLENFYGTRYSKLKIDAPKFLRDIAKLIDDGTVEFVGRGTLSKNSDIVNIYRGNGLTVVVKTNGEWVTLLKSGEGKDKAIQLITQ